MRKIYISALVVSLFTSCEKLPNEKPQSNLVALPDAIMMYNGTKENFMLNSAAKYVPKGITINDLMSQ